MISRLRIRGYKCLREHTLEFGNLNLLVGANASGKSSVIQTLLLLRQSADSSARVASLNLKGELYEAGLATDILHPEAEHSITIELTESKRVKRYTFVHDRSAAAAAGARTLKADVGSEKRLPASISPRRFIYLNAERAAPKVAFDLPADGIGMAGVLGKHGEYATAYLARAATQTLTVDRGMLLVKRLVRLAREIDEVDLEAAFEATQMRLDLVANEIFGWVIPGATFLASENLGTDNASLSFVRDKDKTRSSVRSTHSGFGLTYALPVIAACLAADPRTVLIVENPEAHLHPYSQSRMGAFLALAASTGRQILVETHSDHVINGVRLAVARRKLRSDALKVHFFERPRDGTTASVKEVKCLQNGRLDPWPRDFFDQIERDLALL